MRCKSDLTEIDVGALGLDDLVESVLLLHQVVHSENAIEVVVVGEQNIDESASVLASHEFVQVVLLAVDRDQVLLLQLGLPDLVGVVLLRRGGPGDHRPIEDVCGYEHVGMVVHFHYVMLWDPIDAQSQVVVHEESPDSDSVCLRLAEIEGQLVDVGGDVILFHVREERQLGVVVFDHLEALEDQRLALLMVLAHFEILKLILIGMHC